MATTAIAVALAAYLYLTWLNWGCDGQQDGATLHLVRLGVDTVRARLCYSSDCRLIAERMNMVERACWHCE